ncbi:hypothetical protein LMB73_01720 [Limosilactobacillus reuteri]|uniref:hypothetical protein n=2 Tax=Limosilactobacillus reuteri TaxID=1598 RepID=UPI001E2DF221|nr:hypothetical protein [Limosilactobacillus reuteri]MCC4455227.1 hypothetical protein [Limosilactobacillus reuteri]MCC4464060.1 hypothetical protein [Limosilactobacillus reuteri]
MRRINKLIYNTWIEKINIEKSLEKLKKDNNLIENLLKSYATIDLPHETLIRYFVSKKSINSSDYFKIRKRILEQDLKLPVKNIDRRWVRRKACDKLRTKFICDPNCPYYQKNNSDDILKSLFDILLPRYTANSSFCVNVWQNKWTDASKERLMVYCDCDVSSYNEDSNSKENNNTEINYDGIIEVKGPYNYLCEPFHDSLWINDDEPLRDYQYLEGSDLFVSLSKNLDDPTIRSFFVLNGGGISLDSIERDLKMKLNITYYKAEYLWQERLIRSYREYCNDHLNLAFEDSFIAFENFVSFCLVTLKETVDKQNNKDDFSNNNNLLLNENNLEGPLIKARIKPLLNYLLYLTGSSLKQQTLDEKSAFYKDFLVRSTKKNDDNEWSKVELCRERRNKNFHVGDDDEVDYGKLLMINLTNFIELMLVMKNITSYKKVTNWK